MNFNKILFFFLLIAVYSCFFKKNIRNIDRKELSIEKDSVSFYLEKICKKYEPYLLRSYKTFFYSCNRNWNSTLEDTVLVGLKNDGFAVFLRDTLRLMLLNPSGSTTESPVLAIKLMNIKQNCIYIILEITSGQYEFAKLIEYSKWHNYEIDRDYFFERPPVYFPIGRDRWSKKG